MHTTQNLQITQPGSARLLAGIFMLAATILTYLIVVFGSDALKLSDADQADALIVIGVSATIAVYLIITGWIKLERSKSWKISQADALTLANYLQHFEAATDFVRNHLQKIGKVELRDLTYGDLENMEPLLQEVAENELLALKR